MESAIELPTFSWARDLVSAAKLVLTGVPIPVIQPNPTRRGDMYLSSVFRSNQYWREEPPDDLRM